MAYQDWNTSSSFPDSWDFETQKVIEGKLLEINTVNVENDDGKPEPRRVMTIKQKDGVSLAVWDSYGLKKLFDGAPIGKMVRIEFLGRERIKGTRREVKNFNVGVDMTDEIPF